jgi:hypothetical protein
MNKPDYFQHLTWQDSISQQSRYVPEVPNHSVNIAILLLTGQASREITICTTNAVDNFIYKPTKKAKNTQY